jgi:hypothetical protein
MTLDDVYGPEHDRFPLEQERTPPARALEWDDATDGARRPASPRHGAARNAVTRARAARRAAPGRAQIRLNRPGWPLLRS